MSRSEQHPTDAMRPYRGINHSGPCKDCPRRSPTCHCSCTDYKEWKETEDRRLELARKRHHFYTYFSERKQRYEKKKLRKKK